MSGPDETTTSGTDLDVDELGDSDSLDAAFRAGLPTPSPHASLRPRLDALVDEVARPAPRERRGRRRSFALGAVMGVALSAAAAIALVVQRPTTSTTPGDAVPLVAAAGPVTSTDRTTYALEGVLAVAEPGAILSVDDDGTPRLLQGEAFFRVAPTASDVVVRTAAGDVVVTGTCFRLVTSRRSNDDATPSSTDPDLDGADDMNGRKTMVTAGLGAVAGAALSAAVTLVMVDEGRVLLRNEHGEVALSAGEAASSTSASAPEKTVRPAAGTSLRTAESRASHDLASLQATSAAAKGNLEALVAENQRLLKIVEKQDEELALLDIERVQTQGKVRPFPEDTPERLTMDPLRTAITDAIKQAGIDGEVKAADCSEYPCIVWGTMKGDTRELGDKMEETDAFGAYDDDGIYVSGWGTGNGPEIFAVSVLPNAGEGTLDDDLRKRMRHRTQEGMESFRREQQEAAGAGGDDAK